MTEGSPSGGHFQMASKIEACGVAPGVAPRRPSYNLSLSGTDDKNRIKDASRRRLPVVLGAVLAIASIGKNSLSRRPH